MLPESGVRTKRAPRSCGPSTAGRIVGGPSRGGEPATANRRATIPRALSHPKLLGLTSGPSLDRLSAFLARLRIPSWSNPSLTMMLSQSAAKVQLS